MFTQCPNCSTVYEVHAKDLTVAQGKVRCGFCATTFNALLYLTEDAPEHASTLTGLAPLGPLTDPVDLEIEGLATAGAPAEPAQLAVAPEPAQPAEASAGQPIAATPAEAPAPQGPAVNERQTARAAIAEAASEALLEAAPAPAPEEPAATPATEPVDMGDLGELLPELPRPRARRGWSIAAASLLLLLGAQVVHQWRGELVQYPPIAPLLARGYRMLGLELDPRWDVTRYAVVSHPEMAVVPAADGARAALRLVATVSNGARRAQPYPLIRLTLEDRWGNAVAARDFEPREYLQEAPRAGRLLAPSEEARADLRFVDPGVATVGFTLDVCLPHGAGAVRCANDES